MIQFLFQKDCLDCGMQSGKRGQENIYGDGLVTSVGDDEGLKWGNGEG